MLQSKCSLILTCLLAGSFTVCMAAAQPPVEPVGHAAPRGYDHPFPPLQSGDLIFRAGHGRWSVHFRDISQTDKRFSHVGIIHVVPPHTFVIHASADDRTGEGYVKQELLADFTGSHADVAVFRLHGEEAPRGQIAAFAVGKLGVPFDAQFNHADTNRYYCTELIRDAVHTAMQTHDAIGLTQAPGGRGIIALDNCYGPPWSRCIYDSREISLY